MTTYAWMISGLAAFDILLVTLWFLFLHSRRYLDGKTRVITAIALSGFVFHAVMFFEGTILCLQLATLAVIYLGLALCPSTRQPTDRDRGQAS
jgi:hypothetical protein